MDDDQIDESEGRLLEESITIDAAPGVLWGMVADVTRMGEWSPECTGCRWVGAEKAPVVGARFLGFNRKGWRRWMTPNVVEDAEPGKAFVFRTIGNGNRWGYRFEPEGDRTRVTEFRLLPEKRPWYAVLALKLALGGPEKYDAGVPGGMRTTLERLKAAAENAGE